MATCGSYSKPMLTSRFPRYRKHPLDTPKFMPAPTSLVFLRMARLSPVPTLLTVFSLLLHLLLSFILLYSLSLAILLPALFSPILLALAMSSLHLSLSSLDIFFYL